MGKVKSGAVVLQSGERTTVSGMERPETLRDKMRVLCRGSEGSGS